MAFPNTHWTELAQASWSGDTQAKAALENFIQGYRAPLIEFATYKGVPQAESEDYVQEFLAEVVRDSVLRRADPVRGKFRNFLIGAFKRFLNHRRVHQNAQKRGGGEQAVSLDDATAGLGQMPGTTEVESSFFDHRWALAMLESALEDLDQEYRKRGRQELFQCLLDFLPGGQARSDYETLAQSMGMPVSTFKSEVSRARQRLRDQLRAAVLKTVSVPHEVEEELAYLGQVLARDRLET